MMPIKVHPSFAVNPGPRLRAELVEPHGVNVTDTAVELRVTRQAMSRLLSGHAGLSADMALRFEKLGTPNNPGAIRLEMIHCA